MALALLAFCLLLTSAAPAPAPTPIPLQLSAALPGYVRVVLADSGHAQSAGGELQWLDGLKVLGTTSKATEVTVGPATTPALVRVRLNGKARDAARLVAVPISGYAQFGGRSYRGRLEFFMGQNGGVVVLNVLPLEDYLCGVVPSEMPSVWPADALRAQAVAARSYVLTRIDGAAGATYDVYGTIADQEYHGVSGEAATATQAVKDTAGLVMIYDSAPVCAMYCSDAGGCTAPGRFPYLQPVYSFAPDSKWNSWQTSLTLDQLAQFARQDTQDIGKPQTLRTENDAVTGHLLGLTLVGSRGQWHIGGKQLRKRVGLKAMRSTRAWLFPAGSAGAPPPPPQFDASGKPLKCYAPTGVSAHPAKGAAAEAADDADDADDDNAVSIPAGNAPAFRITQPRRPATAPPTTTAGQTLVQELTAAQCQGGLVLVGSGNGHGVGMSQYGAATLARQGWNYRQILLYFYRGVQLAQLPASYLHASLPQQYCVDGEDVEVR